MKIAIVYIMAGNGHYIPAKNLYESFQKNGTQAVLVDFFKDIIGDENASEGALEGWRRLSRYPRLQRFLAFLSDDCLFINSFVATFNKFVGKKYKGKLKSFVEKNNITHVIVTAVPPITTYLTVMKKIDRLGIKLICYPSDVVSVHNAAIRNKNIDYHLSPSKACHDYLLSHGVRDNIIDIPFPIQDSFYKAKELTKSEARDTLGFDERFTLLYQIGGVGEGNIKLLEMLSEQDEKVRVVILGNLQPRMRERLNELQKDKKNFVINAPGFVENGGVYLRASDILLERSGLNAITEALFLEVPVMTITLYDCGVPYGRFIKKNEIGFVEENPQKQYEIIKDLMVNPNKIETMRRNIKNLNLEFGADEATRIISEKLRDYPPPH